VENFITVGLKIKQRYNPAGFFQATAVFFASFSLAFVVGSLSFIPHDSSAESYPDDGSDPSLVLSVNLADFGLPASSTRSIKEIVEVTDDINVTVGTNNSNGFALTMSVTGSTTGLTHTKGVATIPSTSNLSPADLDINTWGYNIGSDASTFRRIPGLGTQTTLVNTKAPAETATTTVSVGIKADTTFPAGSYSNTLRFTAVAN
jgi:hypothetical protein